MLNVFNRKELCITYDINEQARIKEILDANNIDYEIFTKDLAHPSPLGATAGKVSIGGIVKEGSVAGVDLSHCKEYKIYVKKTDFDQAYHLLKQ